MVVAGAGVLRFVERVVGGWSGSVREASAVPIYRAFKFLSPATPLFLLFPVHFGQLAHLFRLFSHILWVCT